MVQKLNGRILAPHLYTAVNGDDLLQLQARVDAVEADAGSLAAAGAAQDAADAAQADVDALSGMVTAETLVGTWLGSPLYRKVIAIAAGPNNSTVNVAHDITGVADFVHVTGMISNGSTIRPLTTPEGTSTQSMKFALTSTNLVLQSGSGGDYSGYSGHAILYYTKGA